jgi:transmembrane sensor
MSDYHADRRAWRTDQEWGRLSARIARDPERRGPSGHRSIRRWRSAALLAAAVIAIAVVWRVRRAGDVSTQHFRTAAGQRLVVRLGDSSTVTLGPLTTLAVRVSRTGREAKLAGLAYFEVVHDARRPLVVTAGRARVVDLGTRFVVRAYAAESLIDIAVRDGSVSVSETPGDSLALRAGDVGVVPRDAGRARLADGADATDYAAWVEGTLAFDGVSLADVAAELSRWFDVDVSVADATLARRRVTAAYRGARLTDVLNALSATLPLTYTRNGRSVLLGPPASQAASTRR